MIMVIFSIHRNFKMKAVFMDNRVKIAQVNSSLQDSLAGIRVVKSLPMKLWKGRSLRRATRISWPPSHGAIS
jgi:ABC-type multidrug transport system fused ATPase/permease subunit